MGRDDKKRWHIDNVYLPPSAYAYKHKPFNKTIKS